jgi:putative PEP-CTERM system TPR-repeat lipoprotein
MRRALLFGLPIIALLVAAAGGYVYFHHGNLLKDAAARSARGDLRGAEIDLDSYLRGHPDNPEASFRLGTIKLAENNLVAAEHLLRVARHGGYNPAEIVTPLGQTYLQQHRYEDVLTDFPVDKAPPAAVGDTLALRASAYLALHEVDQARQAAAQAMAAAPGKPGPIVIAARIDAAANDTQAAEAKIDALLAKNPKVPEAQLLKIDLLIHRNDLPGALKAAQALVAANPTSPAAKMAEARVLAALNRDVEANKLVDEVLARLPHDIGANYLKLRVANRQHNFKAADAALTILLPVIDQLPQGDYFGAMTKLGVNQPAQAQEMAAKYVAQHPGDAAGIKLLAFADLALGHGAAVEAEIKPLLASGHPDAETLDLQARAQAMGGDIKSAEQTLARAAALDPTNTDILDRLGAAKMAIGQTSAGESDLERSLAQIPDQPRAAAALVQTALANGDIKGAAGTVEQLRRAVGDSEAVGVLDGQVKIAEMDLKGAEAVFTDTLKRFPNSRQATLGLVQTEARLGNTTTARDRLMGWLNRHPDDKLGLKLLVTGDMAGRDVKGAIAAVEAAHGAAPGDIDIDTALATLYLEARMPEKAVDLVDRSPTNGGPVNPALLPLKGQALINEGRLADAQDTLQRAVDALPKDPRPRFGLIELKMNQKDYEGARAVAQAALAAMPGNPRFMEALVAIDLKAHGIKAALQTADRLKQDPGNMPAAARLGAIALDTSGDKAGAAAAFVAAFHEAPSGPGALAAYAALNKAGKTADGLALLRDWANTHPDDAGVQRVLASSALEQHHMQEASDRLAHVLAATPSDAASLNNMAWVKLMTGDPAAALTYARRAYYISPGPETEDTLGWIMAKGGDTGGALPLLEQAASVKPSPGILYHYAVALNGQGRTQDAKAALDKALADKGPFDERPAAAALLAKVK